MLECEGQDLGHQRTCFALQNLCEEHALRSEWCDAICEVFTRAWKWWRAAQELLEFLFVYGQQLRLHVPMSVVTVCDNLVELKLGARPQTLRQLVLQADVGGLQAQDVVLEDGMQSITLRFAKPVVPPARLRVYVLEYVEGDADLPAAQRLGTLARPTELRIGSEHSRAASVSARRRRQSRTLSRRAARSA